MSANDDDLVQDYLEECREHLAGIECDLLAIEKQGAEIDEERVNKVFRAAHSIKGGAGFFNFAKIRELAHRTENVLDLIRSRQTAPSAEVVNVLLLAFDKLRDMIDDPGESERADISEFVAALENLAVSRLPQRRKGSVNRKVVIAAPDRRTHLSATAFDFDTARKSGKAVYLLEYDLIHDVQRRGKNPLEVLRHLMEYGTIIDTAFDLESAGTLEDDPSNRLGLDVLYGTVLGADLIGSVLELLAGRVWKVDRGGSCQPLPGAVPSAAPAPAAQDGGAGAPAPGGKILPETAEADGPAGKQTVDRDPAPPAPAGDQAPQAAVAGGAGGDPTIRLNVALLDSLMNLAGELVLGRNQLSDAIARQDQDMIQAASQRISLVTSDVQEAVMRTRMQPVGNLFQKFPRLVRDMARKLGKEVSLVEEGSEVDLDKTIIEALSDPLTHMVRNAIDHGIESPEVRAARGKPRGGTVSLKAWNEAGLVVVEVADDGKGLDPDKIAAAAVAKGLVSADAVRAMAEQEKLALVLLPGLSTAERVSDISGRGVGMDVVKTNLDRLGGKVEIRSEAGKGAAFRIKLPLTLAIIPSLLVSAGEDRLAIPLVNVQELVRISAAEARQKIDRVGSAGVLMLRDGLVPVVHLSQALDVARGDARGHASPAGDGTSASGQGDAMNVVLVAGGGYRYGLVVERLHDTVEIVVKPLGRHLKHLQEYAGATILGDGCVALILDIAGLAAVAGLTPRDAGQQGDGLASGPPTETHQLLLFQNSPAEACAVPLHVVARVEQIRPEQVERVGGRRSMQYRGRSLPLVTLADAARVEELRLDQSSIVVVLELGGREIGLLGARPVDVIEASLDIDPFTLRQTGVMGSAIIGNRTTLVLDAFEVAETAWPGWNPERERAQSPASGGGTVLVVEDSEFFRQQVARLIESAGCTVLAAEDGQAAWEVLEQRGREIALVVTDVEMPRLDGLQLTSRIRADCRVAHLPVIMLTSLAGEEDLDRGRAAGATAYCVKLDRDQLLGTIRELLAGSASDRAVTGGSGLEELSRHVRELTETAAAPAPAGFAREGERK